MEASFANPSVEIHPSDAAIEAAINRMLAARIGVTVAVEVQAYEGIVTLQGTVPNLLVYDWVEGLVKTIYGVRAVINELLVLTPTVAAPELLRSVAQALADDPATRDCGLSCSVREAIVMVRGQVRTWSEKQLVLRVVRGVRGVRGVVDQVAYGLDPLPLSDDQMAASLRNMLAWDVRADASGVTLTVENGIVTLTGSVESAAERFHIAEVAWATGAYAVNDQDLVVIPRLAGEVQRYKKYVAHPDAAIAQAVRDAFLYDPRILSFEPMVRVKAGIVLLSGTVSCLGARQAAEQDARNVVGVWGVHNYLVVHPTQALSDAVIHDNVKAALARDAYVGYYPFTVNVLNGKVSLYGLTEAYFEQQRAGEVAAGIEGVVQVVNHIQVAGYPETGTLPASTLMVLTDFEQPADQALAYATRLIGPLGGHLVLLHVQRDSILDPDWFTNQADQLSQEALDLAFATMARKLPVHVVTEVGHGRVAEAVANGVKRQHPDMIVLGRPTRDDVPDELIATTALELLQTVPYPMLVVPAGGVGALPRRVLVCVDGEAFTLGAYADSARHLLQSFRAELTVLHVTRAAEPDALADSPARALETVRRAGLVAEQTTMHTRHVVARSPAAGILKTAQPADYDLVLLLARPRSFFGQLFHHSVTADVLIHSLLPVLVLPAQE